MAGGVPGGRGSSSGLRRPTFCGRASERWHSTSITHGSFREAWPFASCSVADRPTDVAPSEGKYHFVMDVADFLLVYPHPIECQTNHVDCTFLTFANHTIARTWTLPRSLPS